MAPSGGIISVRKKQWKVAFVSLLLERRNSKIVIGKDKSSTSDVRNFFREQLIDLEYLQLVFRTRRQISFLIISKFE